MSQECYSYKWGNEKEASRNNYYLFSSINTGAITTIRFSFKVQEKKIGIRIDMEIATA